MIGAGRASGKDEEEMVKGWQVLGLEGLVFMTTSSF